MEQTFVMIKPDAVERKLMGEIIERIEHKGFKIIAMKLQTMSVEKAKFHYDSLKEKSFFQHVIDFITSGPVLLMVVEGNDAIEIIRKIAGETSPLKSQPGTIRGDFSNDVERNIVHTSDSPESAEREIKNFFEENEFYR